MALLVLVCVSGAQSVANAFEKGGIAFILDHGKELNLTDEQKMKLNNMRTLEERTRAKFLAETDTKVLIHKLLEAKRKNDEAAGAQAFGDLLKKLLEKAAPVAKSMMEDLAKTLSPQQLEKVNALKEAQDGKAKPDAGKADEKNRPKRGSAPPNPFEF